MNIGFGGLLRLKSSYLNPLRRTLAMAAQQDRPVESIIRKKLTEELQPEHLDIINESHMHNVPQGSETHFKVVIISAKFDKQPLIKRHRLVNSVLKEELDTGVHALSILAKTPEQWNQSDQMVDQSPPCQGGFGS